ncbi:LysR family transcriptional regulator [Micromonospora sp. M12]
MNLDAVRTFVAAADAGQFQDAAAALSITQQAVSKRIAALEKDLQVRLFTRTARGTQLTVDGQTFLPHARELLRPRRAPTPPCAPAGERCASTCTVDGSHRRCCSRTSTARTHASSWTSSPSTPTSTPRWPPSRRERSMPPSTPFPSPRATALD